MPATGLDEWLYRSMTLRAAGTIWSLIDGENEKRKKAIDFMD